MKKFIPLLGIAGLAVSGISAYAQNVFTYNNGDLILDFSQSGSADLEVNLGSLANLQSEAAANSGTVDLTTVANGYTLSQLSGNFANNNSLSFSVFGTSTGTSPFTDFLTKKRSNPAVKNNNPNDFGSTVANSASSDVLGIIGFGASTGILEYSGTTTANVAAIPNGSVDSYTTKSPGLTGLVGPIKNASGVSFTSGSIVSDLFEYNGTGAAGGAVYEGDFTFNSNGTLDFTEVQAVPEPASYGIMAAAGLLAVSLKSHLRRQQA